VRREHRHVGLDDSVQPGVAGRRDEDIYPGTTRSSAA
jgi:hypothetical protein